jgi:apolipoprotein N-acyltransferase
MPWLVFLSFIPLLFIENHYYKSAKSGDKKKGLFGYAYLTFFVFNLSTTWWIYCVSEDFSTKIFAAGSAIICNSLFMAAVFRLFHYTRIQTNNAAGYLSLIAYWITWEYIHMQWDLSWPWLTLGNVFANNIKTIQWYEYTGVFGGSLWVLVTNILLFGLMQKFRQKKSITAGTALIVIIVSVPVIVSHIMYNSYPESNQPIEVVVVQPNIDPYNEKFSGNADEQVLKMLKMAAEKVTENTKYVVFPETAIPNTLWEDRINESSAYRLIKGFVNTFPNVVVVTGLSSAIAYENGENISETARKSKYEDIWIDYFNTAMQIDTTDNIQLYHKSKLVVGVEKMPYPALFGILEKFAINLGGTSGSLGEQKGRSVFVNTDNEVKIAPVICYESVYGEYVTEYIQKGANLIFIITNDGWWDNTPGYKQHLAYARLRAIETRRSIARSANTGISCFINEKGDVFQPTEWWQQVAISQTININNNNTFYVRYGDVTARLSIMLSGLLLIYSFVRNKTKKPN